MNAIIVYQAKDGTRFDDMEKCLHYDVECDIIAAAMARLKPIPTDDGCRFANGSGYVQQTKARVLAAYYEVCGIAEVNGTPKEQIEKVHAKFEFAPMSIIGRYISDGGHSALNRAWHRFCCIDDQWREWGQPYYARNPKEAQQVELVLP